MANRSTLSQIARWAGSAILAAILVACHDSGGATPAPLQPGLFSGSGPGQSHLSMILMEGGEMGLVFGEPSPQGEQVSIAVGSVEAKAGQVRPATLKHFGMPGTGVAAGATLTFDASYQANEIQAEVTRDGATTRYTLKRDAAGNRPLVQADLADVYRGGFIPLVGTGTLEALAQGLSFAMNGTGDMAGTVVIPANDQAPATNVPFTGTGLVHPSMAVIQLKFQAEGREALEGIAVLDPESGNILGFMLNADDSKAFLVQFGPNPS